MAQDLNVQLTTDKSSYITGEEVKVTVTLSPSAGLVSFYDTTLFIVSDDKGNQFSFSEGADIQITDGVYPNLGKSEMSEAYRSSTTGNHYGWWLFATSPSSQIDLPSSKALASFTGKVVSTPASSTPVTLSIDKTVSKVVTYNNLKEAPLNLIITPVVFTIVQSSAPTGESGCKQNWTCTEWSKCQDSIQQRTCTDKNSCGSTSNKPAEKSSCEGESSGLLGGIVPPKKTTPLSSPQTSEGEKIPVAKSSKEAGVEVTSGFGWWWIVLTLISIILIIAGVLLFWKFRHHLISSARDEENKTFQQWVSQVRSNGASDEQIKQTLLQQGWSEEQVEEKLGLKSVTVNSRGEMEVLGLKR